MLQRFVDKQGDLADIQSCFAGTATVCGRVHRSLCYTPWAEPGMLDMCWGGGGRGGRLSALFAAQEELRVLNCLCTCNGALGRVEHTGGSVLALKLKHEPAYSAMTTATSC